MKTRNKLGTIAVIAGTGSAGKGTIIKALRAQENRQWHENGVDIIQDKEGSALIAEHLKAHYSDKITGVTMEEAASSLWRGENTYSQIWQETEEILKQKENDFGPKWKKYDKGGREARIEKQMQKVFQEAIEKSQRGESTVIDTLVCYTVDFGTDRERKSDVGTELRKYMAEKGVVCPSIVSLAHCDVGQIMEHMDKRNAGADAHEFRGTFRPFEEYGEIYQVTGNNDPQAIGTLTAGEISEADKYEGPEGKKEALLETLGISDAPLDQSVTVKVRDGITYDKVYQTDPKDKGGLTSQDITTTIVQDINQTADLLESTFHSKEQATARHGSIQDGMYNPQKEALMTQVKEASKGLSGVSMSLESKQDVKGSYTAQVLNNKASQKSEGQSR